MAVGTKFPINREATCLCLMLNSEAYYVIVAVYYMFKQEGISLKPQHLPGNNMQWYMCTVITLETGLPDYPNHNQISELGAWTD